MAPDTILWMLLLGSTLLALALWGVVAAIDGSVSLACSGTAKRLGLMALVSSASLLVSSNKIEAILSPIGPGTFVALFILSLVGPGILTDTSRLVIRWILMAGAASAGLVLIYQFAGLTKLIESNASLVTSLIVTIPVMASVALQKKKSGTDSHLIVAIVMIGATLGGIGVGAYALLPKWNETVIPFWANWQILLESYKDWRHLLVGVGPSNFLSAFTLGRPAALNMTPVWDTRFFMGSSLAFHVATVYGLVGTAALGWFLISVHPVAILAFLFLPPSFPALVVASTLLILSDPVLVPKRFNLLRLGYPIAIGVLLMTGVTGYGLYRAFSAERSFERSLKAREALDGNGAYTYQIQAITKSPFVSRYRIAYSQTNLDLADAIARNATSSADTRQTATQLIQQAIREAKIAVNLAPESVFAWENLASVYQTLTGVAQGADQWSVASFQKAVSLDPTNPILRLRLGGAYVGQQKFDAAAQSYLAAINLKPDYANAYYNLAFVYRQQKKYLLAAQTIKETRRYVTSGADEKRRLQEELDELTELLTEEEKRALDTQTQGTPNVLSPLPESP